MRKIFILSSLFILLNIQGLLAQAPFSRGVNLAEWFQADNVHQMSFAKYTKQDLINIKSLGCDVVRLPINMHYMTFGAPDYTFDPLFYTYLDSVVTWAENLNLYLLLDNHTFSSTAHTDTSVGPILVKVWGQMAEHYKNRSKYIMYEILNEPHDIPTRDWGVIQQNVINTIRAKDTKHTIIIGGSSYNHYTELKNLPIYADTNLLYTFHFYDPFIFSHQGASWTSLKPITGVPFPYDALKMPARQVSLKGTWGDSLLNCYNIDGTEGKIKLLIDVAINFKNTRNINIFCGEFGAYIPNSKDSDRTYWHEVVRKYLEVKGIPWILWSYQGGFGLFKPGSAELFNYDLNIPLLNALGLKVPLRK